MLAARRTDKVIGRINTLTNSITTISIIKPKGVPKGTRWARNSYKDILIDPKIRLVQTNMDTLKVNLKWLVGVNT
jgi:hypothetical protein